MTGAFIDLAAALLGTAAVLLLPGIALASALRAWPAIPVLLRPAAAIAGTIVIAAPALVVTLALQRSIMTMALLLFLATLLLGTIALLRWTPSATGERRGVRAVLAAALPQSVPALVIATIALVDAPHVRSDTYWHVALARKLGSLEQLSGAAISFEAGAPGNANYPLPTWHALIALADQLPRVELWAATWFLTVWMAPVAMLAFAGMATALVGDRRAGLVASWCFVGVVVLGYGPWFFATRYLAYPGQVAIYVLLPLVVAMLVRATGAVGRPARWSALAVAALATCEIGLLHGNYVLYPVLFAAGGVALLLLGRRTRWRDALLGLAVVGLVGAATLAAQLPWITNDDNFLRGGAAPAGEPTAFQRHRDAFRGSEESFHVALGLLAAQPLLVLGALALPVLLLIARRRPGPWFAAGGALAIVAFGRSPQLVELIDRLGSVTPATRFDRVYPAAIGVVAAALGAGWLLERAWLRSRHLGGTLVVLALAGVAGAAAWLDSIRDTRRIVVTQFVEARWVGGLEPDGLPRAAVIAASLLTLAVAAWSGLRVRARDLELEAEVEFAPERAVRADGARAGRVSRHALAALVAAAVVVGLAPVSLDRLADSWQPEAYAQVRRGDGTFTPIDVYPAGARRVIEAFPDQSVVLAGFNDTRRIAALAPVYSVEESQLRELVADPPRPGADAARRLDALVRAWDADYVAASSFDASFRPLLDAAAADPAHYALEAAGTLRVFRVRDLDADDGS